MREMFALKKNVNLIRGWGAPQSRELAVNMSVKLVVKLVVKKGVKKAVKKGVKKS